jgi:protein-S-isoprenylcysteine O-methyltransferase Ste14
MELKYLADIAGRAALVAIFGILATAKFIAIAGLLQMAKIDWLELATQIANLAFVFLVVCMAIIRVKPVRGSDGWEARLSALAGSSLPLLLLALPIGRSFSIMPQARRLVTTGPYGLVRHPLYMSEEIAVLGVMGLYLSPAALAIVAVHWIFQLRRMANEEKVLLATFREYLVYAQTTPKFFPYYFSKCNQNA